MPKYIRKLTFSNIFKKTTENFKTINVLFYNMYKLYNSYFVIVVYFVFYCNFVYFVYSET